MRNTAKALCILLVMEGLSACDAGDEHEAQETPRDSIIGGRPEEPGVICTPENVRKVFTCALDDGSWVQASWRAGTFQLNPRAFGEPTADDLEDVGVECRIGGSGRLHLSTTSLDQHHVDFSPFSDRVFFSWELPAYLYGTEFRQYSQVRFDFDESDDSGTLYSEQRERVHRPDGLVGVKFLVDELESTACWVNYVSTL